MKAPRWARPRLIAVAALALSLASTACVLFVAPPARFVRWIAESNADWLLSNYMEATTGPLRMGQNAWRKLVAMYVQYGLAAAIPDHHPLARDLADVERLSARLALLRSVMVNHLEVPHEVGQWAPLLSALGFCDQMNAMAANVLAREFEHAQIVGLFDPATQRQHTIGRVWSAEERAWLYFDLWGSVAIFRVDSSGRPRMLRTFDLFPGSVDPTTAATIADMYNFAASGNAFTEYPSTLGGFIYLRLRRMVQGRTLDALAPAGAFGAPVVGSVSPERPKIPESSVDIRRRFVRAQLARLFGEYAEAALGFRKIAAEDRESTFGRAAAISARRAESRR